MTEWEQAIIDFHNCKVEILPAFESLSVEEQLEFKRE